MGTGCLTIVIDTSWGRAEELIVLQRQSDGYPEGHGEELAAFLSGFVVGNGMGHNMPEKYANGADCLAAQIVAHFKTGPGGFYMLPTGTRGELYLYKVTAGYGLPLTIQVIESGWDGSPDKVLFEGTPEGLLTWLAQPQPEE